MGIFNFSVDTALICPGILSSGILFSVLGLPIDFKKSLIKWYFSHCSDFILSLVQPDYENDL